MTERGLPLAAGATACPFVAYDDDRDERSSVPDHRHRCFAEASPAPRALAHQEAYCLSSAFPVCPTFQDWARREAARSRDGSGAAARAARASDRSTGDRGSADPPVVAPGLAAAAAAASTGLDPEPDGGDLAGITAGGLAADDGDPDPDLHSDGSDAGHPAPPDDLARRNPPRDWAAPPPWLASNEARRGDDADPPSFLGRRAAEPGAGLAGSAADRMAGGAAPRARETDEEWTSAARAAPPTRAPARREAPDDTIEEGDEDGRDDAERRPARRPRAYAQHLGGTDGPDWERPRRYEAYPAIRSRVALPRVPRAVITAVALLILAPLALFFLPGMLNIGGPGKPTGSAAASAKPVPSVSVAPTTPPAPTPQLYTIRKGETLSKIATNNGLTLEELLAANPSIKNPDKVGEGQQIIIPVPSEAPPEEGGASTAP